MKSFFKLFCFSVAVAAITPISAHARILSTATTAIDLPVYEGAALERPFRVIGKVLVQASQANDLKKEMARVAKREGGDAVLKFKIVDYKGNEVGAVTTPKGQVLYGIGTLNKASAEGVIVEYVRDGGITVIDDLTAVPILD